MGTITFVAPGFRRRVRTAAADNARHTLLAVAKAEGIPILFTCEAGGCGACIVRVEREAGAPPRLTFEESMFLRALGKLEAGIESDDADGVRFRLACQYLVGDEDIVVDFTNELGSA